MKHTARRTTTWALTALLLTPLATLAQTPFAGEDFDEGATNGGFAATTMVFTPDLSGSAIRSSWGSRFDRFGEVSRIDGGYPGGEGLPFGLRDDSLEFLPGTDPPEPHEQFFAGDTSGFVAADKFDDFVVSIDTVNPNNAGPVSAVWTFDISGRSNLGMSMDFGMLGEFEDDDFYEFTYSIDGGPEQLAFRLTGGTGDFYAYTMDDGTVIDRVESPFFNEMEFFDVIDMIGTPGLAFHDRDNGLDGDSVAMDGLVPVTFATGVEEVRGYQETNDFGTFNNEESGPVQDPLVITSGDGLLINEVVPADFTNYSTALEGAGTTLTLTLNGLGNGGDEWFAFDNILLSEGVIVDLPGDYNADGFVDAADYTVWADGGSPDSTEAGYDLWVANYGRGTAPSGTAVPEPAALGLALLAAAAFASRRNG